MMEILNWMSEMPQALCLIPTLAICILVVFCTFADLLCECVRIIYMIVKK